ncbi:uncharacterized protein LOC112268646 [Brachypodium distachyon]|uniref:uncharacterized protein LOC112268646 n=1 Tax=Brachypodium distachyon TaxID=15368 RepID=UPI000D0D0A6C|nr:uncharacterized protein LOC112268646 [Brachypodium distachyon]|eukprot:XP_024310330.1 uncharacterized protein LOC112268646 [Brachypodium distachyon]
MTSSAPPLTAGDEDVTASPQRLLLLGTNPSEGRSRDIMASSPPPPKAGGKDATMFSRQPSLPGSRTARGPWQGRRDGPKRTANAPTSSFLLTSPPHGLRPSAALFPCCFPQLRRTSSDCTECDAECYQECDSCCEYSEVAEENAKLKKQTEAGILKCHQGIETLNQILGLQIPRRRKDGIGFQRKYNVNGDAWLPKQYPPTKFVQGRGKYTEVPPFVGNLNPRKDASKRPNSSRAYPIFHVDESYILKMGKDNKVRANFTGTIMRGEHAKPQIWVPKSVITFFRNALCSSSSTNMQEPMKTWVPKRA